MSIDQPSEAEPPRHRWAIEPAQYERHESRRGRRHAFDALTAPTTALVVIDVVPFFVEANPYTLGIVPTINALASALRDAGGTVAWVVPSDMPLPPARIEFFGQTVAETYRRSGGEGTLPERLWSGLELDDGDLMAEKSTPSAFFPGGSTLDDDLQRLGVDTVIIAGTVANVCVESSARDASTLGYRVVLAADAISAVRDADLDATLCTIYRSFGDVRTTNDILDLIGRVPD